MSKPLPKTAPIAGWRPRNEAYLEAIRRTGCTPALIVCAADKVHNLEAVIRDYRRLGDELWARFNAGKPDQLWWYHSALKVLQERLPDNPLTSQLAGLVAKLDGLTQ